MATIARILVDEAHRQAWSVRPEIAQQMNPQNPADASLLRVAELSRTAGFEIEPLIDGAFSTEGLVGVDIVVIPHAAEDEWESTTQVGSPVMTEAEMQALESFVTDGGGLLILGETEAKKYGNSHVQLAARFGIGIENATIQDPQHCLGGVATWVLAEADVAMPTNLLAGVDDVCMYRAGFLSDISTSEPRPVSVLRASADASHPHVPLLMVRADRKSTRLNSSHVALSRMPSSA